MLVNLFGFASFDWFRWVPVFLCGWAKGVVWDRFGESKSTWPNHIRIRWTDLFEPGPRSVIRERHLTTEAGT